MFEYVLVLYLKDTTHYVGNFESCAHASTYLNQCYFKTVMPKEWSSACLYKDYIYLPEGFQPVNLSKECSKD